MKQQFKLKSIFRALGMAQVVIYQHKKPFVYQKQLLKAQDEAKKKKLGIWSL